MNIPYVSKFIQRVRDRASVAENQRLRKAQLERDWKDADSRHEVALAEHKTACQRYHANPTEENLAAMWRYYERTWELFEDVCAIWRKLANLNH